MQEVPKSTEFGTCWSRRRWYLFAIGRVSSGHVNSGSKMRDINQGVIFERGEMNAVACVGKEGGLLA